MNIFLNFRENKYNLGNLQEMKQKKQKLFDMVSKELSRALLNDGLLFHRILRLYQTLI